MAVPSLYNNSFRHGGTQGSIYGTSAWSSDSSICDTALVVGGLQDNNLYAIREIVVSLIGDGGPPIADYNNPATGIRSVQARLTVLRILGGRIPTPGFLGGFMDAFGPRQADPSKFDCLVDTTITQIGTTTFKWDYQSDEDEGYGPVSRTNQPLMVLVTDAQCYNINSTLFIPLGSGLSIHAVQRKQAAAERTLLGKYGLGNTV